MICGSCGKGIVKGAAFCQSCGAVVTFPDDSASVSPSPSGSAPRRPYLWLIVIVVLVALVGLTATYLVHKARQEQAVEDELKAMQAVQAKASADSSIGAALLARMYADASDGATMSNKRHDDAVSDNPDDSQELKWAKQEQNDVQTLQDDVAAAQSAYGDVASDYERALGPNEVAGLRADVSDFATQYGLVQGNWSRAVSDIIDNINAEMNGSYGSDSGSDIGHFYQASDDAQARGNVDLNKIATDVTELRSQLTHNINITTADLKAIGARF